MILLNTAAGKFNKYKQSNNKKKKTPILSKVKSLKILIIKNKKKAKIMFSKSLIALIVIFQILD